MKKINFLTFAFLLSISFAYASPNIWTTDAYGNIVNDFSPISTVYFNGDGFNANSFLTIDVYRPDGNTESCNQIKCHMKYLDGYLYSDSNGQFRLYRYYLNGLEGEYIATVSDGQNTAQFMFTDASVWTSDYDCSPQQKNSYSCGQNVTINGDGLTGSATLTYDICNSTGGSSCPSANIVYSGNVSTYLNGSIICKKIWTIPQFYQGGGQQHKLYVYDSPKKTKTFDVALCQQSYCGDNITTSPEECDPPNSCQPPYEGSCVYCNSSCKNVTLNGGYCGDNIVNGPEECDDGNTNNTDSCLNNCSNAVCGDGYLGPGEQCDDNNNFDGDGCSSSCVIEFCGDYIINIIGEECDPSFNCTPNYADSCYYCDSNCLNATAFGEYCGDNVTNGPEECDDNNTISGDGCSATCVTEFCGDNIVNNYEQCDGSQCCEDNCNFSALSTPCENDEQFCTVDHCNGAGSCIQLEPMNCSDGVGCTDDSCDEENDKCVNSANNANCNNGLWCDGEEYCDAHDGCLVRNVPNCDDSIGCTDDSCNEDNNECVYDPQDSYCNNCQYCNATTDCTKKSDVFCDGDEYCGDTSCNMDTCTCEAAPPECGNGILENGEECDDGNQNNNDSCLNNCEYATCGDIYIETGVEECDPPDSCSVEYNWEYPPHPHNCTYCNTTCQNVTLYGGYCGDGIVQEVEECEGAEGTEYCQTKDPTFSCSLCFCTGAESVGCGNGVVDSGEECDDGNEADGDGCSSECIIEGPSGEIPEFSNIAILIACIVIIAVFLYRRR